MSHREWDGGEGGSEEKGGRSQISITSMLFSPLLFFCTQKVNNWLSMQITPCPLAYPEPIRQWPPSSTVLSQSISAKVCPLTEMIQSLEALLKERTLTPPLSLPSHPPQLPHPPPLSYHQADPLSSNPLVFPLVPYDKGTLSYLLPGWPLLLPPTMFTPHWEQLQNSVLHLSLIVWNPFWSLLQPHHPQVWTIVPISYESYLLPSPFPQDPVTWVQSFQVSATCADPQTTSTQTVPITIVPPMDEPPQDTQITNVLNFIASTVSNVVTPMSSISTPCSDHDLFMNMSWDLSHYKTNERDRNS